MPAIILSDNGVTSGSAGLKTSGGNDGVLQLQTTTAGGTPTTAISISNTQVVTYTNQPTYTGGTANGVLYLNGSKAVTSGTALVFDGTNLGVGVTPSAWASSLSGTIENRSGGLYPYSPGGGTYDVGIFTNAYYDGSWRYKNTGSSSSAYFISASTSSTGIQHTWRSAGTGTAGNAIAYTDSMVLTASGNLGVGTTSPSGRLHTAVADGATNALYAERTGASPVQFTVNFANQFSNLVSSSVMTFSTNGFTERARIDSTGNVTKPFNSCFLAARANTQTYSAGNAIVFDNEVFDQNSNYNPSTGVFTAPVTGKYLLSATILVQSATVGSNYDIKLTTSNRSYLGAPGRTQYQNTGVSWGDGYIAFQVTQICDMDASDTAYVGFSSFSSGSIYGSSSGDWTRFSGCLIS